MSDSISRLDRIKEGCLASSGDDPQPLLSWDDVEWMVKEIEALRRACALTHAWIKQTLVADLAPGWGNVYDATERVLYGGE